MIARSFCKTTLYHHSFTALLDRGYQVFLQKCCVWFSTTMVLGIWAKQLWSRLSIGRCFRSLLVSSDVVLWTLDVLSCFSLKKKRLPRAHSHRKTILVQSSTNCAVMDLNIEHVQWGLQGLRCGSWIIARSWFWGRLSTFLNAFHLWIIFLTLEHWTSNCVK